MQVADSKDGAEPISVDRAFRAMKRANVAVLVIDGSEGITQQVGAGSGGRGGNRRVFLLL